MRNFLISGLFVVPAWLIGRWMTQFDWADPFVIGWACAVVATTAYHIATKEGVHG